MTLRNYGARTNILLRLAPWADLDLVREKLVERLLKLCEQPDYFTTPQRQQIADFAGGKIHIMGLTVRGQRALERTVSNLYSYQRDYDGQYNVAFNEFVRYFFRSDEYLGIRT